MAIRINKTGSHTQYGTTNYTIDTVADLATVPTCDAPGSLCFCIENSKTYILNSKEKWIEKYDETPGGGGSEYPDADARTFPVSSDTITFKTISKNYNDIVKSINIKLGTELTYTPAQMSGAIDSIPSGTTYPDAEEVEF